MSNRKTDPKTELTILAMLARGDTQQQIARRMDLSPDNISKIKARNLDALEVMQTKMIERTASLAAQNHELAMQRLNKRLENENQFIETKDLVSVSKEMFQQKQIENREPTSITAVRAWFLVFR